MLPSYVPIEILGVIPARFASTRFPGKALVSLGGKPIVQHVYDRASSARHLTSVVIATDDDRIADVARGFGARIQMTREDHPSGTDRVAEVASSGAASVIVNIQGDEPLIDPAAIDAAVLALLDDDKVSMATLKCLITDPSEIQNPNVVKVVTAANGDAIYFSRCPIPFHRQDPQTYYKHIGLYVYRRDLLLQYSDLPMGPLEKAERLEQLRAIENGYRIRVAETDYESLGVDTPEDLEKVSSMFEAFKIHG